MRYAPRSLPLLPVLAVSGLLIVGCSSPRATSAEPGVSKGASESATPTQTAEAAADPLSREQMITIQENCSDVFIDTQAYATIEGMSQADADYVYMIGSRKNDPAACEVVTAIVNRVETQNE